MNAPRTPFSGMGTLALSIATAVVMTIPMTSFTAAAEVRARSTGTPASDVSSLTEEALSTKVESDTAVIKNILTQRAALPQNKGRGPKILAQEYAEEQVLIMIAFYWPSMDAGKRKAWIAYANLMLKKLPELQDMKIEIHPETGFPIGGDSMPRVKAIVAKIKGAADQPKNDGWFPKPAANP